MEPSELVEAKGAFAKRCGVSPGRVSQWISEGLISSDALVGDGRSAKIRVEVAQGQLRLRRDIGQSLGNGLDTRLEQTAPAAPAAEPGRQAPPVVPKITAGGGTGDVINEQLKRERLWKLQAENRVLADEEAARTGLYTDTALVRAEYGRIAGRIVRIFEGALPEIATGLAAAFRLDSRDVTHQLGELFRKAREKASDAAAEAASALPATVEREPPSSE